MRPFAIAVALSVAVSAAAVFGPAASAAGGGGSAVADAAMRGDRDAIRALLKQGADANAPRGDGMTALHFAALSMDSVVELLVMNGAKLDLKDKQGRTPLDMASGKGGPGRVVSPGVA